MLRLRNLRNKYQKRLIRPLYAQTQATPYAAVLDPTFRDANHQYQIPTAAPSAFLYLNGLVPGTVMVKGVAENVLVSAGGAGTPFNQAFGLLANFVGGDLDELGEENFVGVWRGPDSVYEILAPGFNPAGLSAAYAAATTAGLPVFLYAGPDGRLCCDGGSSPFAGAAGNRQIVAHLIDAPSPNRIVVDLKV